MGSMINAGELNVHVMGSGEAMEIFLGHEADRLSNPLLDILEALIFPIFLDMRWFLLVADLNDAVLYVHSMSGPDPGNQTHEVMEWLHQHARLGIDWTVASRGDPQVHISRDRCVDMVAHIIAIARVEGIPDTVPLQ